MMGINCNRIELRPKASVAEIPRRNQRRIEVGRSVLQQENKHFIDPCKSIHDPNREIKRRQTSCIDDRGRYGNHLFQQYQMRP